MVGRQTSRGCATCRARRVKCDLAKPACICCVKAGRSCPGYSDRFISVSSKRIRQSESGVAFRFAPADLESEVNMPAVLLSSVDRLRNEFVWKMECDALAARFAMMSAIHVLKHIPQRIGHSRALDDAVTCIVQSQNTRRLYVTALESLQSALNDLVLNGAVETLAAASLLQMYEQYADDACQSWIHHARGVVRLLQVRGTAHITDDIERAVLGAQAANVFMSALTFRTNCFLTSSAWSNDIRSASADRIDVFMQTILDHARFSDIDSVFARVIGPCPKSGIVTKRLIYLSIAEFWHIRAQLRQTLACNTIDTLDTRDKVMTATYAAIGFFLIVTNTVILTGYDTLKAYCGHEEPSSPAVDLLKAERLSTLRVVAQHLQLLDVLDPRLRLTTIAALRAILGSSLGLGGQSDNEASTILLVLGEELEDSRWEGQSVHATPCFIPPVKCHFEERKGHPAY